jgi:TetR/AcrR family transcriptional regulator, transcriptional repressor for nem operon
MGRKTLRSHAVSGVAIMQRTRGCLCGMLAAEYETLPPAMQQGVRRFFDANEAWLTATLTQGRKNRQLAFKGEPAEAACVLVSALEGAMLLARTRRNTSHLRLIGERLLADLAL